MNIEQLKATLSQKSLEEALLEARSSISIAKAIMAVREVKNVGLGEAKIMVSQSVAYRGVNPLEYDDILE